MMLNLGCGRTKLDGFVNVDSDPGEAPDVVHDLGRVRWPWPDDSVDAAVASHVLEHLPGETFFFFLRELYRVCKDGAEIHLALPWPTHDIFRIDPTHVRPVLPSTMLLFSQRHVVDMAERGVYLTDFGKRNGINFEFDGPVVFKCEDGFKQDDPDFEWNIRHLNNVVVEWTGVMRAVKS